MFKNIERMKNKRLGIWVLLIGFVSMLVMDSCKRYDDPPPVFEDYGGDSTAQKLRKVMVISIDGLSGKALKELAPPNVGKLMANGKYSFDVLPSLVTTDASTWVTMLTGVGYAKHQITDSSFMFNAGDFDEDHSIPNFPTIFTHILPSKPQYNMAMVTPWANLANYTRILNESLNVKNDKAVRDSSVSILKSTPGLGLLFVDFNGAELAGIANSFAATDPAYKDEVMKIDQYIGDITAALKARENYDKEDWLIIVTTNHGGSAVQPTPGFMILSNSALTKEEVKKAGFNAVAFKGANDNAGYATMDPVVNGNRVYDFQEDFTIQFDVLFGSDKSGSYPYFFGNKFQLNGSTYPGFSMLIDYDPTWTFNTTSGSKFQLKTNTSTLFNSSWHTVGFSVEEQGDGSRVVSTYVDGEFKGDGTLPSGANLNSNYPLTIGWISGAGGDYVETNVHNIKLFDVALDAAAMKANKCVSDYTELKEFDDLVGFWAADEATGGVFLNSVNSNAPFLLHGVFDWKNLGQTVPCSVTPPSEAEANALSIVPTNSDIAANILYWLEIKVKTDWNLDGSDWLKNFEDEIYDL